MIKLLKRNWWFLYFPKIKIPIPPFCVISILKLMVKLSMMEDSNCVSLTIETIAKNIGNYPMGGIWIISPGHKWSSQSRLSDLLIFSELTHIFWATSDLLSYLRFSKLPLIFWVVTDLWDTSDFLSFCSVFLSWLRFSEYAQIFRDC